MKQVVQNYRTGQLKVEDLPAPALRPGGVLVRTARSLISAGTERTIVETAQSSLIGKARSRPDLVRQVITLGTPVVGGPKYTVFAHGLRDRGIDVDAMEAQVESRNRMSLTTPVTAIYSRADAVVTWEACIDRQASNVEHIEVGTSHLGLGFSPEVYLIIAQRLAGGA